MNAHLIVGAAAAAALIAAMWERPGIALVTWLLSVAMVPHWVGVSIPPHWLGLGISFFVPIQSAIALLAIIAIAGSIGFKLSGVDMYLAAILGLAFLAVLLGGANRSLWFEYVIQWGFSYLVARIVVPATGVRYAMNSVAIVFALVGGLALIEFLLRWHPYVGLTEFSNSTLYRIWAPIQSRGGLDRSEWAFGHSIALGGSLALAIPFVISSTFGRSLKLLMMTSVAAGIAVTFSRGAIIAAALTLLLCAMVYVAPSLRVAMAVIAGVVLARANPLISDFARGSTTEERTSALHRQNIYEHLLPTLRPFGKSYALLVNRNTSIDSAFLWIGANFGWIVVILLLIPLAVIAVRLIRGKASMVEAGLLGQLPLLLTVSLITQYESFVFFVAGFAVQLAGARVARPGRDARRRGDIVNSRAEQLSVAERQSDSRSSVID